MLKMAVYKIMLACTILFAYVTAQRPSFAGFSPIGYPEVESQYSLSNRFSEDEDMPIEARGDRNLIYRLNQLPIDSRPFWYLNWRQYEALRQQPKTWPLRNNQFIGPV